MFTYRESKKQVLFLDLKYAVREEILLYSLSKSCCILKPVSNRTLDSDTPKVWTNVGNRDG